jgi:hypothetical protein
VTGLRWRIFRRCGCPLCLRWPSVVAVVCITACHVALFAAIVAWTTGLRFAPFLVGAAAAGATAIILGCWPRADHLDDMEALIGATRECRACSPEDYGPCRCTEECGNIRCTAGFPARPDVAG